MKRRLLSAATFAALSLSAVAVPASALTINVDGQPAANDQLVVGALVQAADRILKTGASVTAGDTTIVYDPRALEQELDLPEETVQIVPPTASEHLAHTEGQTADGRKVITPAEGQLSSGYGDRWGHIHQGIDIANGFGTPILSVMDGTVIEAGPAQGFGNWVVVQHDGGEVSVYGHMRNYDVSAGQRVSAGEQIATIGSEGQSTGPHLHFEIKSDGVNQVDPQEWLEEQGISL